MTQSVGGSEGSKGINSNIFKRDDKQRYICLTSFRFTSCCVSTFFKRLITSSEILLKFVLCFYQRLKVEEPQRVTVRVFVSQTF